MGKDKSVTSKANIGNILNTVDILGVKVALTTLQQTSDCLISWIEEKRKTYICFAPVSTLVDCQKSDEYKAVINNSAMTNPDGMPLVWVSKLKGHKDIERTCGPDLIVEFCRRTQDKGYSHYFYGGSDENNEKMISHLRKQFPNINIAGHLAPPYRKVGEIEVQEVIDQMNAVKADILWVGLGSPKQDYWMANHRDQLNIPIICGVGAAFDFLAGVKPMAPEWMRKSGLEWLFRLSCEPKRLWKRYIVGNSLFIYYLITRELFKHG